MTEGVDKQEEDQGGPVERMLIRESCYRLNKFVTIAADVMFVSGVPFFVTYSKKIKFATAEYLPRCTARQLANSLRKVIFLHARGVFLLDMRLWMWNLKK